MAEPLIDPLTYILCSVLTPFIITINIRLYKNIKNEEHLEKGKVVQYILKSYSLMQCFSYPCIIVCSWMIYICNVRLKIMHSVLVRFAISSLRYMFFFTSDYYSFHSLIIAICRYTFIVFNRKSETFGIKKLRSFFIASSIGVPICTSFMYEITTPIQLPIVDFLYGQDSLPYGKNTTRYLNEDSTNNQYHNESPVYIMANEYFPSAVIFGISLIENLTVIMISSNIIEGCLYTHLFIFYNRYQKKLNFETIPSCLNYFIT